MNREQWLTTVAKDMESFFRGLTLVPYRVTCGWPSSGGIGLKKRTLGQCHGAMWSTEGLHELFISPLLAKPDEVAGVLCHEMAHIVAGVEANHGKKFVDVRNVVGLTKNKPPQAMPGPELAKRIKGITDRVGVYPHSAMKLVVKKKTKNISSVGLECPACECRIRIGMKWLEESGMPTCGCGEVFTLPEE